MTEILPWGFPLMALGLLLGAVTDSSRPSFVAFGVAVGLTIASAVSAARVESPTDPPILAGALAAVAAWIAEAGLGGVVGVLLRRIASRLARASEGA